MCKKKPKENNINKQKVENNVPFTLAFIFISIVFSLTMGFLVFWTLSQKSVNVREVNIELSIPQDSIAASQVISKNDSQFQNLVEELNKQSQEITDKYEILLKSEETESDFFRLISCIAAFVIALFSFLGLRTIKDIEVKAQSLAEDKARDIAREYVSNHLEPEVESQLKDLVGDSTAARLLREQLLKELIPQHITPLESRINKLESEKESFVQEESNDDESDGGAFVHDDDGVIAQMTKEANKEDGGDRDE